MNQNTHLSSLLMTANWMTQSTYRKRVLPPRRIFACWRNELTGTSWNSVKENTKSFTSARVHLVQHRMAEEQHCRKQADKPNISQTLCRGQQRKDKRQKTQNGKFWLDVREKNISQRVVKHWIRQPREVMEFLSLNVFKTQLHKTPSSLI